jgi:hypothetical protein
MQRMGGPLVYLGSKTHGDLDSEKSNSACNEFEKMQVSIPPALWLASL